MVYGELGGNSLVYSVNYERELFVSKNLWSNLSVRVGFGVIPVNQVQFIDSAATNMYISPAMVFPLELMYYLGRDRHKIEAGMGWTPMAVVLHLRQEDPFTGSVYIRPEYHFAHMVAPSLSYRYQSHSGFFLKAGVVVQMLFYGTKPANPPAIPFPRLSLGYRF